MALTPTAAHASADHQQGAVTANFAAGAAMDVLNAVYVDGSGNLQEADANGASEAIARAIGVIVAPSNMYGETAIPSGARCTVCTFGPVYGFSGMTPGATVYVGTTPGSLTQTPPVSPAYQFAIGYALADDILFINPESDAAYSV